MNINDQDEMREAVRHERMVELAMEGWRFYDIRRWDIAEELMNDGPATGMTYRDIATDEIMQVFFTDVNYNFQKMNEDYIYPVPWEEFNMNPNLLPQNEGW